MRGLPASALPISPPGPVTTLMTPAGTMSPMSDIRVIRLSGVFDAGLITVQLPAAMAGAIFQAAINRGKFHGMIWPTTPMGSLK